MCPDQFVIDSDYETTGFQRVAPNKYEDYYRLKARNAARRFGDDARFVPVRRELNPMPEEPFQRPRTVSFSSYFSAKDRKGYHAKPSMESTDQFWNKENSLRNR